MKTCIAILISTVLLIPSAFAAKPIARCVNADGELTYTDYLCVTEDSGNNPLLMNESAVDPSVRSVESRTIRSGAIVSSKLSSATAEAQSRCQQRFAQYFKRKYPSINSLPDAQFENVIDQYVKGNSISISLRSPVQYEADGYSVSGNIECTVQRFNSADEWVVGIMER